MRKSPDKDLLRSSTLYEMLESVRDEGKQRILNGLDFPMGHLSLPPPPQFRQVPFEKSATMTKKISF
jgi:hypothetical protein